MTAAAMQPLFTLQDVAKDYNRRRVLEIPALEIIPGEILALVGPSGAGKSTLLRLFNFLEHPPAAASPSGASNSGRAPRCRLSCAAG